jgi:hypothetical protein
MPHGFSPPTSVATEIVWRPDDITPGVYFIRVESGAVSQTARVVFIR